MASLNSTQSQGYTCPMHPEIQSQTPGRCPLCGMSLEPVIKTDGEDFGQKELKEMSFRFWASLPLSLVVLISMQVHLPMSLDTPIKYLQLLLAGIVVYALSFPIHRWALDSLKNRYLNMWTLIGIGVNAAYLFSAFATFFPTAIPKAFLDAGKAPNYFEAASVICTLTLLGQVFELKARASSGASIKSLLKLTSDKAWVVDSNGKEAQVSLSSVQIGDILRVKPGEQIPVDGTVIRGFTSIDESMISGEPIPVEKQVKDKVIAGTLNSNGSIDINVEGLGSETLLSRIIEMVSAAQRTKAPMQKLADKIANYFVSAVILLALATFIGWGLFAQENSWGFGFINAISVLIIACPCALGLATPMSVMNGTELGARNGVIFRDASAIEQLTKVDTIVIDKTGTLTVGRPVVTDVMSLSDYNAEKIIELATSANEASEHPLAKSLLLYANEKKIQAIKVESFEAIPGYGVSARIHGEEILVGNKDLMVLRNVGFENGVANSSFGKTEMYVSLNKKALGVIYFDDAIKPTTLEAAKELRHLKKTLVMATGDSQSSAEKVAALVGIKEYRAGMKPATKYELIREMQSKGRLVAMAGDGVNDAPALAQANVGIAMGTGSDAAIEAAEVTLVSGDLRGLASAIKTSTATVRNMKQNLWFAFGYNGLSIPIAAGLLYPAFGLLLSPTIASAAMSLSSVSVILNAIRLRNVRN
jgi:Cu+-exporting ATPase